jgi:hypothetical protein
VISGWVFVYDGGETEELLNQNLVSTSDQTGLNDKQFLRIVTTNTGGGSGRFRLRQDPTAGTDPQPALNIGGLILAQDASQDTTIISAPNVTADGRIIILDFGSGPWRQTLTTQIAAASFALRRATQAVPIFNTLTLLGDPRRQLSDSCLLLLGGAGTRVVAYLAGITRTLDATGLRDELIVRATHAPNRWALDDPVLGKLETTARLG